jgi:hypothetical protein
MVQNNHQKFIYNKHEFCCLDGYKFCKTCEKVLELSSFSLSGNNILKSKCKDCSSKQYYENKYIKNNLPLPTIKGQKFYIEPTEKICICCNVIKLVDEFYIKRIIRDTKRYRAKCKKCVNEDIKTYKKKNKQKVRERERKRLRIKSSEPEFKIMKCVRHISAVIRKNKKLYKNSKNLLGIGLKECRSYIENQFNNNMTWENYGKDKLWVFDHIIPVTLFDFAFLEPQFMVTYYKNLRPLSNNKNSVKNDILPDGQRAQNIPKIKSKQQLLDLIQTWPNPAEFEWVKEINVNPVL